MSLVTKLRFLQEIKRDGQLLTKSEELWIILNMSVGLCIFTPSGIEHECQKCSLGTCLHVGEYHKQAKGDQNEFYAFRFDSRRGKYKPTDIFKIIITPPIQLEPS